MINLFNIFEKFNEFFLEFLYYGILYLLIIIRFCLGMLREILDLVRFKKIGYDYKWDEKFYLNVFL